MSNADHRRTLALGRLEGPVHEACSPRRNCSAGSSQSRQRRWGGVRQRVPRSVANGPARPGAEPGSPPDEPRRAPCPPGVPAPLLLQQTPLLFPRSNSTDGHIGSKRKGKVEFWGGCIPFLNTQTRRTAPWRATVPPGDGRCLAGCSLHGYREGEASACLVFSSGRKEPGQQQLCAGREGLAALMSERVNRCGATSSAQGCSAQTAVLSPCQLPVTSASDGRSPRQRGPLDANRRPHFDNWGEGTGVSEGTPGAPVKGTGDSETPRVRVEPRRPPYSTANRLRPSPKLQSSKPTTRARHLARASRLLCDALRLNPHPDPDALNVEGSGSAFLPSTPNRASRRAPCEPGRSSRLAESFTAERLKDASRRRRIGERHSAAGPAGPACPAEGHGAVAAPRCVAPGCGAADAASCQPRLHQRSTQTAADGEPGQINRIGVLIDFRMMSEPRLAQRASEREGTVAVAADRPPTLLVLWQAREN
ncbi:hypothetical protein AAFF_G00248970 [Aldrovandia affinis]|uniref:Uncharacterized protein n=1 Tax=Aldrovandia affinis TaxID=143900 RepID=A0AAD7RDE5_9TELE|nr:hypothetical protein AAFF_G00248970 [Aldrovandia affinis]